MPPQAHSERLCHSEVTHRVVGWGLHSSLPDASPCSARQAIPYWGQDR